MLQQQQQKETLSIWLVKLQYILFALWNQRTKAELSLAQGGQRGLTQVAQHDSIGIAQ